MISRRHFLQASLSVALVSVLPRAAFTQTTLPIRPGWDAFRLDPRFQVFVQTIATMKANTNSADPNSWVYWANAHKQFCPHGLPYFLAWHRGFLSRFEARLRIVSGDSSLVVPYWDYYTDPALPAEFLDDTSPLWRANRVGNNVFAALSLDPFADTIIYFPRGKDYAFEPTVETAPHNPVHNLIGGIMASTTLSPLDPIFWVHHANIDRLWAAWILAGNGRRMPAATNSYWTGSFSYGAAIKSMPRLWTRSTTEYLKYQYDNLAMPAALPAPPAGTAALTAAALPARPLTTQTVALDNGSPLALDEGSKTIDVLLTDRQRAQVRSLLLQAAPMQSAPAATSGGSIRVVLDDVHLTALGGKGGYFYKIYLNLPEPGGASLGDRGHLLGMLGAFEVSAERMRMQMQSRGDHGGMPMAAAGDAPVQLVFPITGALQQIWPEHLDKLTVSFVRADGGKPRRGTVITVKSFRVEIPDMPAI